MREVKRRFPEQCQQIVRPAYAGYSPSVQLSYVDVNRYLAWQTCFRAICPDTPIVLDVLWNWRRAKREEGQPE